MSYDTDAGFYDVRYNFFLRKTVAIEARGWDTQPDYNETSSGGFLFVALIYSTDIQAKPEEWMKNVIDRFIEHGKVLGKISSDYNAALDDHDWSLT